MSFVDIAADRDNCNNPDIVYWAMSPIAAKAKISRSMMGKLAKLVCDYERATRILASALRAREPVSYLSKTIANLRREIDPVRPEEPEIALHGRLHGWVVRKTTLTSGAPGWWVGGVLYNKDGDAVGA